MERASSPPPREGESRRWEQTKGNAKTIGGALLLALFIRIVLFEAFEIEGPSMEPTLLDGDRVVVAKFLYGLFPPISRGFPLLGEVPVLSGDEALLNWGIPNEGDVIIVHSPYDNQDIVKRVIGVPGDRIRIEEDEVFRNDESILVRVLGACDQDGLMPPSSPCENVMERIDDHSWITSRRPDSIPDAYGEVTVPEGHVFVLGDHRDRSNDSRNPQVGMIPANRIKGRALSIYWSYSGSIRTDRIFRGVR